MKGSDKINKVLAEVGLKPAAFARTIGLKAAQNVYDIQKDKTDISKDVAQKIITVYPNFRAEWLLTGEGEMLKDGGGHEVAVESTDSLTRGKVIPLYDVEAVAGNGYEMNMTPTSRPTKMIQIGGFLSDSESAIQVFGNSMVPNYPAGCIIGVRLHRDSFIEPGKVYVIETRDNRFLKRLYLNKEKTAYRCLSDNHMKHSSGPMEGEYCYPEFDIPFDDVIRLHRVIGVIKRNTM